MGLFSKSKNEVKISKDRKSIEYTGNEIDFKSTRVFSSPSKEYFLAEGEDLKDDDYLAIKYIMFFSNDARLWKIENYKIEEVFLNDFGDSIFFSTDCTVSDKYAFWYMPADGRYVQFKKLDFVPTKMVVSKDESYACDDKNIFYYSTPKNRVWSVDISKTSAFSSEIPTTIKRTDSGFLVKADNGTEALIGFDAKIVK